MYECADYAYGRLVNTVIRIKGEPCLVLALNSGEITYRNFGEHLADSTIDFSNIGYNSPHVDLTPIPVGYVNFKEGALYLVREAARRWKQGLDGRGLSVQGDRMEQADAEYLFFSTPMNDCLTNNYPSFAEAIALAEKEEKVVAFHLDWAVSVAGNLWFKGRLVGNVIEDKAVLDDAFIYLQEALGGCL